MSPSQSTFAPKASVITLNGTNVVLFSVTYGVSTSVSMPFILRILSPTLNAISTLSFVFSSFSASAKCAAERAVAAARIAAISFFVHFSTPNFIILDYERCQLKFVHRSLYKLR